MFGILTKYSNQQQKVIAAKDKAVIKNLAHAAASGRKREQESFIKTERGEPSRPGEPPHTRGRRGRNIKTAVLFDVDKQAQDAVYGPRKSHVGLSAHAHEFGGEFKGEDFEPRPFARPSLEQIAPRFGESFEGSIGR